MENPQPNEHQQQMLKAKMTLEHNFKSGAGWFNWIAGLSVLNSAAFLMGLNWAFIVGLGVTQMVDAIVYQLMQEEGMSASIKYFGFGIDVLISAVFVLFGFFARKGHTWAFFVGMFVYFLDALIFLLLLEKPDWMSIGFHGFALYCIWGGFQAGRQLKLLEEHEQQASMGEMR